MIASTINIEKLSKCKLHPNGPRHTILKVVKSHSMKPVATDWLPFSKVQRAGPSRRLKSSQVKHVKVMSCMRETEGEWNIAR